MRLSDENEIVRAEWSRACQAAQQIYPYVDLDAMKAAAVMVLDALDHVLGPLAEPIDLIGFANEYTRTLKLILRGKRHVH